MPVPLSAFAVAMEAASASVPSAGSADALLLQVLLAAAVRLSGLPALPVDAPAPVLVDLPVAELHRQACPERPRDCARLIAWHDAAGGRVLLSDQLDWRMRPVDRSFVLHELVHVLQARRPGSTRDDDCARALDDERLAYRVQNAGWTNRGAPSVSAACCMPCAARPRRSMPTGGCGCAAVAAATAMPRP